MSEHFPKECYDKLAEWEKGARDNCFCLGVDIGGSTLRARFTNPNNKYQFFDFPAMSVGCSGDVYRALAELEETTKSLHPELKCVGSAFAIPGLKVGNTFQLANWSLPMENRTIDTDRFSEYIFPRDHHMILNDIEACCYGLIFDQQAGKLDGVFERMWGPEGPVVSEKGRTIVYAMGTGLGCSVILNNFSGEKFVMSTEYGYHQFHTVLEKHPDYEEEHKFIQALSDYYYEGKLMPCYEDLCSGRALGVIYKYHAQLDHVPTGYEVIKAAKAGDKNAIRTLTDNYRLLMRLARNMSITFVADNVVFALSNQVKDKWLIDQIKDVLEKEFRDHTRPYWLDEKRAFTQVKDINFNLSGTSYIAYEVSQK